MHIHFFSPIKSQICLSKSIESPVLSIPTNPKALCCMDTSTTNAKSDMGVPLEGDLSLQLVHGPMPEKLVKDHGYIAKHDIFSYSLL